MPATGVSDMDREIFRKNADPLYAFNASAKGAKAQRNKLRLEHGQSLASFTMQTLGSLPSSLSSAGAADAAAEQPLSLLRCAREAARLVLWLGSFQSPEPEKLCYNVAARCLALREHASAAELSAMVVCSLSEESGGGRGGKAAACKPPPDPAPSTGPWELASPSKAGSHLELGVTSLLVHLRALEALSASPQSEVKWSAELARSIPVVLEWLEALVRTQPLAPAAASALNQPATASTPAGKAGRAGASPLTERAYAQLSSALRVVRSYGACPEAAAADWEAKARQLTGRPAASTSSLAAASSAAEPPRTVSKAAAATTGGAAKCAGASAAATPRRPASGPVDSAVEAEAKAYTAALEHLQPAGLQAGGAQQPQTPGKTPGNMTVRVHVHRSAC